MAYTIAGLAAANVDIDAGGTYESLFLAFKDASDDAVELSSGERAGLVLQLDSREFAFRSGGDGFSAFSYNPGIKAYFWDDVSPDIRWEAMVTVSVKLCVNE